MKFCQKFKVRKSAFFCLHTGMLLSLFLLFYALRYLHASLYGDLFGAETLYAVVYKGVAMIERGLLGAAASLAVGFLLLSLDGRGR